MENMNKDIKKILWVTALYSFAGGLFYNFIELWLLSNKFSVSEVSTIYSIGAFATAVGIIIFSYVIKQKNIQNFTLALLIIKSIIFYLMFQINGLGFKTIIGILFIIDFVIDTEIYVLLYPMISTIKKDDKLYATRGLTYEVFYYIAYFISGLLIGKVLLTYKFTYNSFAILGTFILFASVVILLDVDLDKYIKKDKVMNSKNSLFRTLDKIKKDKISILYLVFVFFATIARFTVVGVTMIILTKNIGLSSENASYVRLLFNISAVLIASLILRKFTFKNNYINIFIRYGLLIILYLLAIFYYNNATLLIAIGYTFISASTYTHVMDAPYINRYKEDEQIAFVNIRETIRYISRAIGTYICGLCLAYSFKLNISVSLIGFIFTIILSCSAYYYINKNKVIKK